MAQQHFTVTEDQRVTLELLKQWEAREAALLSPVKFQGRGELPSSRYSPASTCLPRSA